MPSNLFEYITAGATLLSFILAVVPYFESYKQYIIYAFVLLLGMFLGAIFTRTNASTVLISYQGSIFQTFVIGLIVFTGFIIVAIIIAYALSPKPGEDFNNSKGIAGVSAFGFFVFLVLIYGLSSCSWQPVSNAVSNQPSTLADVDNLALAKSYEEQGNISLALTYYKLAMEEERRKTGGEETLFYRMLNAKIDELLKHQSPPAVNSGK